MRESKENVKVVGNDEVVEQIDTLIKALHCVEKNAKLFIGSYGKQVHEMRKNLENVIEKQLKGVHTNKICQTKDGRFKTHNPQIIKKTRLDLLIALYEHYFHEKPQLEPETIQTLFEKWSDNYMKRIEQGHRSISTLNRYKQFYNRFLADNPIADRDVTKITYSELKDYYAEITAHQAITRKQLNNVKTLINALFDFARDKDIPVINTHDTRTMDLICKETDNEYKVYTDEERRKIIAVCDETDNVWSRAIILMFCLCIRIGELKALKWSDIDLDNRMIYIHRSMILTQNAEGHYVDVCVDRTKNKRAEGNRYQPLSDKAAEVLRIQQKNNPFGEFVFMNGEHSLNTDVINKWLKRICKSANVGYLSSHKIRFWSVTALYNLDVPQAQIQKIAGHADPATTDHYKRIARLETGVESETWMRAYN